MKTDYLLDIILKIAYDMLVAGSEVGMVEQQIDRMCRVYEMKEVEVFIITSSIIVSVKDKYGMCYTQTKRIKYYQSDFYKIELLEQLVRYIENNAPDEEEITHKYKAMERMDCFEHGWKKRIVDYLLFCVVSMVFTIFFGGCFMDAVASFVCGFFIKLSLEAMLRMKANRFMTNLVASFVGAISAWIIYQLGMPISIDKVNIGNIMLLIPGLATVNSFKDLISGEMITGLLRLTDAILQALAIACGFVLVLSILGV